MDNLENEIIEKHYEPIDTKLAVVYSLCIFQLISVVFLKNWRESIVRYYSAILVFVTSYYQFTSYAGNYYKYFIGFLFLLEGFLLLLSIKDLRFRKALSLKIPYVKLRVHIRTPNTIFSLFFSSVIIGISLFFDLEAFDSVQYQSTFLAYILSLYQFVAPLEESKTVYCFIHHALFTQIPMFISLLEVFINLQSFALFDRPDLAFICLSILVTHYFRLKPTVKQYKAKPPAIQNPKEEQFIDPVIQERPRKDGGIQGEPKLSVYMDNEGDLANEFYIENHKKITKVAKTNLKKIR
ncbi:unnamed protein product [Blepharisma stoltei]|uniref:Uncharacterized protein n=1 Tax=Blepharisma stoltei TaxID=1481888 RepID=A0AAU9JIZ8_9CILI|nr:unnamed protein product [Blepharisma stoltei]